MIFLSTKTEISQRHRLVLSKQYSLQFSILTCFAFTTLESCFRSQGKRILGGGCLLLGGVCSGVSAPGAVCSGRVSALGGLLLGVSAAGGWGWAVSALGGVCSQGGICSQGGSAPRGSAPGSVCCWGVGVGSVCSGGGCLLPGGVSAQRGGLLLGGSAPRGVCSGWVWPSDPGPHPRGKLRGIRPRPTPKGEIEGDQVQAHTQGGN